MQPGKDFRVRRTKITRYIFKYITRFWTLKSTSILGGSFTWIVPSALFPQTVWCSHGWTCAPLRASPTVHWTTHFGWRNVKTYQLSSLKLFDALMVEPLLHLEQLQRCTGQPILDEEKSKHVVIHGFDPLDHVIDDDEHHARILLLTVSTLGESSKP
jgi:hypothetical protein